MAVSNHSGGCHCGAIRYEVELDAEAPALICNCSMCGRAGTALQFVPEDKFTLQKGSDNLTEYRFNKQHIRHTFCKTCGIKPFANAMGPQGPTVAINVRTLDDIDVFAMKTQQYDGKSV